MRAVILWVAPPIDQDQALHCTVAGHVRDGRWAYQNSNGFNFYSLQESGLSPYNHPLYHLVTGMMARVLGNVEHAARTVSFVAGLGAMIVLFLAARLLLPPLWALVVLAGVALHPGLAYLSATAYTESLYLFMLSVALWCVAALWRGGRVWPLVAGTGVAVGLAALTKPEANLLAPVYALFAAARVMRAAAARPRPPWLRGALALVIVLGLVQAAMFPYRLYFRHETGKWKPVSKSLYTLIVAERYRSVSLREAFFGLNAARTDTVLAERLSRETMVQALARDWPWLIASTARNALRNLKRVVPPCKEWSGPALLLLGATAAVRGWRRRRPGTWLIPAAAAHGAVQLATYSVLVPPSRPIVTLVPALVFFIATSLGQFVEQRRATIAAVAVCIVLATAQAVLAVPELIDDLQYSSHLPAVGAWLREKTPPDAVVMCHDPGVAYYAQRRHAIMPVAAATALRDYANHRGADYVVVDMIKDHVTRDPLEGAAGFTLETEMDFGAGAVRIYRVSPAS